MEARAQGWVLPRGCYGGRQRRHRAHLDPRNTTQASPAVVRTFGLTSLPLPSLIRQDCMASLEGQRAEASFTFLSSFSSWKRLVRLPGEETPQLPHPFLPQMPLGSGPTLQGLGPWQLLLCTAHLHWLLDHLVTASPILSAAWARHDRYPVSVWALTTDPNFLSSVLCLGQ